MKRPHLLLAHDYWKKHLRPGDCAIDATCGNGRDTLALANIILNHPQSAVWSLDIQQTALENAESFLKRALSEPLFSRILFHHLCHAEIDRIPLPHPPRLIVYNLGYLPGGNKAITTETTTTLQSVQKALLLLGEEGALSITCYPGHPEGKREEAAIVEWASGLSSLDMTVCYHRWVNRPDSPSLFWIARNVSSETQEQPMEICGR